MRSHLDEMIRRACAGDESRSTSLQRLSGLLRAFAGRRVLVLGDLMLDEYIWGQVSRVSPEAPVPVVEAERYTYCLGGACNVAANIQALGGQALVAGVVGADASGEKLLEQLHSQGADTRCVLRDPARPTTVKTRVVAHSQQVVRIDRESRAKIDVRLAQDLLSHCVDALGSVDAVLISDYDKGVFIPELTQPIIETARQRSRLVTVNPKPYNLPLFRGSTLISMNQPEAQRAANTEIASQDSLEEVGRGLLGRLGCEALMVTRGAQGICLFQRERAPLHLPTLPSEVYDVTGAGDTVVSVATVTLAAGGSFLEAAALGNAGGSLKVRKLGAASVSAAELLELLDGRHEE